MADVVNLNRFKKAKAKTEKTKAADANRIKFGLSKAEKHLQQKQTERAKQSLDGHKRDDT